MKITKAFIEKEVVKLDPKVKRSSESFFVACILLSALQVGANSKKVAKFLEVKENRVKTYAKNLKESGIWKNGKTHCDWFDEKDGGIAFWCDVLVGEGKLKRK